MQMPKLKNLLLCIIFLQQELVSAFRVLNSEDKDGLELYPENPDLLRFAALQGSNVTVNVTEPIQLVISQDSVFLTLDCNPLLQGIPIDPDNPPRFIWERRRNSSRVRDTMFIEWGVGDSRLQILGPYNSLFHFNPTNIHSEGESSDGGDYKCTLGVMIGGQVRNLSRIVTLLLVGSAPVIDKSRGCTLSNGDQDYTCFVGKPDITLPSSVDSSTGVRSLDIIRFVLQCEPLDSVTPTPRYSWTKDGATVVRNLERPASLEARLLDDEFYMLGNNCLLLLLQPQSPINLDTNLRLDADFSLDMNIWNFTAILPMFPSPRTTVEDVRRIIRDSILGNWTCTANNSFGSDSASSIISVSMNCSNGCLECEGDTTCTSTDIGCECRCLPGFSQDSLGNCTDIDECLQDETNNCNNVTQNCVNMEGGYNCTCRMGFVFLASNQSCLDCGFGSIKNGMLNFTEDSDSDGSLVVEFACDDGFESEEEVLMCKMENDSVIMTPRTTCLISSNRGCDLNCLLIIVAVVLVLLLIIEIIIILIFLIVLCLKNKKPRKKHSYYTGEKNEENNIEMVSSVTGAQ